MTELLHYDNNDQYRDAVDAEGDVVFIGDIGEDIDNLAAERFDRMRKACQQSGRVAVAEAVNAKGATSRGRPRSTRGGRSYNEPSDSELDPNWNVNRPSLSNQQRQVNKLGARIAKDSLR